MIKAGQMKRREDEELIPFYFFIFFIKHLLWRFNAAKGHSSQLKEGIKNKKNKKPGSVYHTILFLYFFLFFSEQLNLLNMHRHHRRN